MRPSDLSAQDLEVLVWPRHDGLDGRLLVQLAESRWGRPLEPWQTGPVLTQLGPMIRPIPSPVGPTLVDAVDAGDATFDAIRSTLLLWPAGAMGFIKFVNVFWPLRMEPRPSSPIKGCSSGHQVLPDGSRGVYVTVDDIEGCCDGLMHEYGHLRLEAMGIDIEGHDGTILANANDELYESPIRRDKLRPMSAVLHGFYSWLFLTRMDLEVSAHGRLGDVRCFLEGNLPKIEEGILTLRDKARWTGKGEAFWSKLQRMTAVILSEGWETLGGDRADIYRRHREWVEAQPVSFSRLHHGDGSTRSDVRGTISTGDLS